MIIAEPRLLKGPWPASATVQMQPPGACLQPEHLLAAVEGVVPGPAYLLRLATTLNDLILPTRPAHAPASSTRLSLPGLQALAAASSQTMQVGLFTRLTNESADPSLEI